MAGGQEGEEGARGSGRREIKETRGRREGTVSEARRRGRETEDLTGQGQIHARVSIVASTLVHLPAQRPTCPHANPNCIASSHRQVRTTTHTHTHKHTYSLVYDNRPVHTWYTHVPGQPPSNPEKN